MNQNNIYNLIGRAEELRNERSVGGITPEEVGGLHYDTLVYMAEMERNLNSIGIRKIYRSVEEMNADNSPVGLNGKPLRLGQLAIIYNPDDGDYEHNGRIYVYLSPGWEPAGNLRLDLSHTIENRELIDGHTATLTEHTASIAENRGLIYGLLGKHFREVHTVNITDERLARLGVEGVFGNANEFLFKALNGLLLNETGGDSTMAFSLLSVEIVIDDLCFILTDFSYDNGNGRRWTVYVTEPDNMGQTSFTGEWSGSEYGIGRRGTGANAEVFNDYEGNVASGDYSHAEGYDNVANADYAHAEGLSNYAQGTGSHAEGISTRALGNFSHAEGYITEARGDYSHAEGSSKAIGEYSHAEGKGSTADANSSHSEGDSCKTYSGADCSHVEGKNTVAYNRYEHAQGIYNKSTKTDTYETLHSIGIGDSSKRMNAMEVSKDGRSYFLGVGGYDGTNPEQSTDLQSYLSQIGSSMEITLADGFRLRDIDGMSFLESEGIVSISDLVLVYEEASVVTIKDGDGSYVFSVHRESDGSLRLYSERCVIELPYVDDWGEPDDYCWTIFERARVLRVGDVVDGLASTETEKSLSANQGRVLDSKIGSLGNALNGRIDGLGSIYKVKGTKNFAEVMALTDAKAGWVYNVDSEFTLNGKPYAGGTNLVCVSNTSASSYGEIHWDALGGTFDTSNLVGRHGSGLNSEVFNDYEGNVASGDYSHAEGYNTAASGEASHAGGRNAQAVGAGAHAEGNGCVAVGDDSHAEGNKTKATGLRSHAEGANTESKGERSHAEGYNSKATGKTSHVEGQGCEAIGECSHAEGYYSEAKGYGSHAEGSGHVYENGEYGHAEGLATHVTNPYEHAEGAYNLSNKSGNARTRHSIGIGKDASNRKNAFEVLDDGRSYFLGVGGYDGTNPEESKDLKTLLEEILHTLKIE